MNYDHRFHAGNFADVLKHVVLARVLLYLERKPAPFRVIDTHAGYGAYDLTDEAANRTGEWREGIGRLDPLRLSEPARALIAPYLDVVGAARTGAAPYPGSPLVALRLTRPADRLIFCEIHPRALAGLKAVVGRDKRAKVIDIDGYTALKAYVPPVERRGLVLIDPPFEAPDEFARLTEALVGAWSKWREGVFLVWYPLKDRAAVGALWTALKEAGAPDLLRLELEIDRPRPEGKLVGTGLILINPPYTLEQEMICLLPELRRQLGAADAGFEGWRVERHGG